MNDTLTGLCHEWTRPQPAEGSTLADVLRSQRRLGAIVHDAANDELYPAAREFLQSLLLQKPGSVFVSADYDVDGVTSAAILGRLFRSLGIRCAASLPCRFTDGYGVNYKDAAARFSCDPFDLLVTADCGGADTDRLKVFAAQINRRVFVLDHHLAETVVDDGNLTVLNPAAGGRSPQYCAAVLCALVVRAAVAERLVPPEFLAEMEMLAGLAVVADCVRVDGIAARHCLDLLLRKGAEQGPPGIRGLFVAAGLYGQISTADVAFKLAPMLNAAGRIESAVTALETVDAGDLQTGIVLAQTLKEMNIKRAALQESTVRSAALRMRDGDPLLLAYDKTWHPGVTGPAAGQLAERLRMPVFLGAVVPARKKIVFSGRSGGAVDIHQLMIKCTRNLDISFGGHAAALGLQVENDSDGRKALEELSRRLTETAPRSVQQPVRELARYLSPRSVTTENFRQVRQLEPYGPGNPAPIFCLPNVRLRLSKLPKVADSVKGIAEDASRSECRVVAFRNARIASQSDIVCHAIGEMICSRFRNSEDVQFLLHDLVPL